MNRYLFLVTFLVVGYLLYPTVFNVTAEAGLTNNTTNNSTPSGNTPTTPTNNTTTNNTTTNNTTVNQCSEATCNTEDIYQFQTPLTNPPLFSFVKGCLVPSFAVNGVPVCPLAYIINAAGTLCMSASCAPPGGACIKCSDCPTGQGAGACHLICKPTCP
jgi:hypothetical protein